jgi:hypothetical protein
VFNPATLSAVPRVPRERNPESIANELLATSRAITSSPVDGETELSLRRQLSRLQRQLAESQRELANKDDEVAAEVEKRLETTRELEEANEARRLMQARLDELLAYAARTEGIEKRLQDAIATADELVQVNDRERAETAAMKARIDEVNVAFEETRNLWNSERKMLEERHDNELATLDGLRKAAVEASAEALNAQATRLRETNEAQVAELKSAYETSLFTLRATHEQVIGELRGDLEPRALQAATLAEERERLIAELADVRNEAIRETVEREESYKRETQQAADAAASELATVRRLAESEVSRAIAEKTEVTIKLEQATKAAEAREQAAEDQADALRATIKAAQREAAELRERVAALESDKTSQDEALERSREVIENMLDDKKHLEEEIEAARSEARRNALERHRFVAYLEEGLALLGALPPQDAVQPEAAGQRDDVAVGSD